MKSLQLPVTNAKGLHASDELLDAPIELLMSALPYLQGAENSKASASERVWRSNPQGDRRRPLCLCVLQSPSVHRNSCSCFDSTSAARSDGPNSIPRMLAQEAICWKCSSDCCIMSQPECFQQLCTSEGISSRSSRDDIQNITHLSTPGASNISPP